MIAIHWQADVRLEGLNIRYIGFRNRTSLLAPPSGEMCHELLHLQLPGIVIKRIGAAKGET